MVYYSLFPSHLQQAVSLSEPHFLCDNTPEYTFNFVAINTGIKWHGANIVIDWTPLVNESYWQAYPFECVRKCS